MGFVDFVAGVALLVNDIVALISLAGSALCFAVEVVNLLLGRRRFKAPAQFLYWSIAGLLFGAICFASLVVTHASAPIGLFRMSLSLVGLLLFASFALLVARTLLWWALPQGPRQPRR